ncbi:MAG: glycosyltransferase [Raoultibacter sp.]
MKPDFSIVIPAFNEEAGIPVLAEAIERFVATSDIHLQFVFVDDGSADETFNLLSRLFFEKADVKVVKLSRNFGAHAAIRAGVYHSDADCVMLYSSDMPEPIEDITRFYEELQKGFEIVYSERVGYKGSLGSRMFGKMVTRYIEKNYPEDGLIGVAFGNKVKQELNDDIETNSSIFFQIFQLGFSRKAIPVAYNEREQGESKWTLSKKVTLFVDSFVMFSYTPIRAISGIGLIMALLGFIWALVIVICKAFNLAVFAAGWPTMMSILLIGFGITNISLGIIAEYLVRTLDAARNRRTFITDEIVETVSRR